MDTLIERPRIHEKESDCDGMGWWKCNECNIHLCNCEQAFGHDCEE